MSLETSTRRQIITAGLISSLPLVSGCSSVSRALSDSEPELGQITVENSDNEPHTVHIAVEQGSDLIYGSSQKLDPISAPEDADDFGSIDSEVLEDTIWANKDGDWTIHARVDERTAWQSVELPSGNESSCYSVRLKIEDDGSITTFSPDCGSWPPNDETSQ